MPELVNYRVLYLEDDVEVAELCRSILASKGFEIETAPTGKVGLKKFKKRPFDIVLLKHRLPDTDGLKVARSMIQTSPDLPIVFITTRGGEKIAAKA